MIRNDKEYRHSKEWPSELGAELKELSLVHRVDGWRGAVLLAADVLAPRDGTAPFVDILHRYLGHEAVRGRAVPVVLVGLEEH